MLGNLQYLLTYLIITWEQRKLGDVAQYRNGKAHENCIDENGKYVVVNSKFVSTDGEVKKFSNMQNEALFENEIAFVLSDVPNGRAIARTYLIEKSDKYTLNQRIAGITPLNETYPYFLYILMNRHPYFLAFDDGAKQTNLSVSDVMGFETYYPKYSEQQKIGAYFRNLDNLITLHQRKYDKLQNIKKSMLEKMFPKNGSNVPEIRFSGFTDPWEQRKLNEIADKVTEKNAGLQYIETFTNSAEFGIISQRDFFDHDIAKMSSLGGYYIVRNEDFVYNPRISTSAPVGPTNRNKLGRIGVMSPLYTVFRPHDVDTTYLEYFFKSKYWHSFMNFNGDSGARSDRFSIKDSVFFEMPIPLPYTEEQEKIGQYFSNLDNLITLHQRELEKLQNIKKSMLEKMFV